MKVFNFTKKMNVKTFFVTLAFVGLSISTVMAQNTYSIIKSGSDFKIKQDGFSFYSTPIIQEAIDFIRDDVSSAGSVSCIIQFGEGDVLDLGGGNATLITFENAGTKTWGKITLTGKATTACATINGIIRIKDPVSVECKADITSTDESWLFSSNGILTISDGTISANGTAIRNSGTLTISKGVISTSNANGCTIANYGNATISGGTILASCHKERYPYTIYNGYLLTISGGTIENTHNFGNTIVNEGIGQVEISGGIVKSKGGNAVTNLSTETIIIENNGKVFAQEGYAINNEGGGTVNIKNNGTVFAYGSKDTDVINGSYNPLLNNAIIAAWDNTAGTTSYILGTGTDIYKIPAAATAVWAKQGGEDGILVKYGAERFIPIEGVTVGTTGISDITNNNVQIFPSPTSDILYFSVETPYEIIDLQGKLLLKNEKAVNSVNISSLPSGTYFVTLHTETGKVIRKLIKE